MFDFLRKRALRLALTAKKRASGGDRNRRRTLFLEPLEERRLLAADLLISDVLIDGVSQFPGGTPATIPVQNLGEGQVVTVVVQATEQGGGGTFSADANFSVNAGSLGSIGALGSDVIPTSSSGVFLNGATSPATLPVAFSFNDDLIVEGFESFSFDLQAGTGSTTVNPTNVTTDITDNDSATVSIADVTVAEGVDPQASLSIVLSGTLDQAINIDYVTQDGAGARDARDLAVAGVDGTNDYEGIGTTNINLINNGDAENFTVDINDDSVMELSTETFVVKLAEAAGSSLLAPTSGYSITFDVEGTVTITDTDTLTWSETVSPATAAEGDFDITTSGITGGYEIYGGLAANRIQVTVAALDGSAEEAGAGIGSDDYDSSPFSGDLLSSATIDRSSTGSGRIAVVNDDTTVERDETIGVEFTVTNDQGFGALLASTPATQQVIIENDDTAVISFVPAGISVAEGDTPASNLQAFTIVSSADIQIQGETFIIAADTQDIGGENATASGTATGDGDYTSESYEATSGTPTAWDGNAGTAILSDDVNIITDEIVERDEDFQIVFTAATNLGPFGADLSLAPALDITILNDDTGSFAITASSAVGPEDSGTFSVDLSLDARVQTYGIGPLTITGNSDSGARTADGDTNAYTGTNDYDDTAVTLSYDGTTLGDTQTFTVSVTPDSIVEIDEQFIIDFVENNLLGYGAGAHPVTSAPGTNDLSVTTADTTITIQNDETATVTHANLSGSVAEGTAATFQMELSAAVQTATFSAGTIDNTRTLDTRFATADAEAGDLAGSQQPASAIDGTISFPGDEDYTPRGSSWSYTGGDTLTFPFSVDSADDTVVELQEVYRTTYAENDYLGYGAGGLNRVQLDLSPTLGLINQEDSAEINLVVTTPSFTEGTSDNPEDLNTTGPYDIVLSADVQDYDGGGFDVNFFTLDGVSANPAVAGSLAAGENGDRDYVVVNANTSFVGWDGAITPPTGEARSFNVDVRMDEVVEVDEDFSVNISEIDFDDFGTAGAATGQLTINNGSETVTIGNDDSAFLEVRDAVVSESAGTVAVEVALNYAIDVPITVRATASDGLAVHRTATSDPANGDEEYQWPGGVWQDFVTLSFAAAGADSGVEGTADPENGSFAEIQTVTFDILDDAIVERDEEFYLSLFNLQQRAEGAVNPRDVHIGDDDGSITITDDDTATITIGSTTLAEDGTPATLTVSTIGKVDTGYTFDVVTADGSAGSSLGDYTPTTTGYSVPAFSEGGLADFSVPITDDSVVELTEDLLATINNLNTQGRSVELVSPGVITITDADLAFLSINDISFIEGDSDTTLAQWTVTLDAEVDVPVTVDYGTLAGTATSATTGLSGDQDYLDSSGQLTFVGQAGEQQQVSVYVTGDRVVEATETLSAILSNVVADGRNVDIGDDSGSLTITNDDAAVLSIQPASTTTEGSDGQLVVTLSDPVDVNVSFDFTTANGTAINPDDYTGTSGSDISFSHAAGAPLFQVISIPTIDESLVELAEDLTVTISDLQPSDGSRDLSLGSTAGTITIENNDSATVTVSDVVISEEAGTASLEVTLDNTVDAPVTVPFQTLDGTALQAFGDYTSLAGTLVFAPGETQQLVDVTVTDDDIVELDEFFSLGLEEAQASGRDVTVVDDSLEQTDNTEIRATGRIDLLNTDTSDITITADQDFFIEGDDGITSATLTVSLSNPVDIPILLAYATANGDYNSTASAGLPSDDPLAVAAEYAGINSSAGNDDPSDPPGEYDFVNSAMADGHDYDDTESVLNFPAVNDGLQHADPLTQQITIPVYGDTVVELDEWFSVTISGWEFLGRDGGADEITVSQQTDFVWIDNNDSAAFTMSDVTLTEGDAGSVLASVAVTLDNAVDAALSVDYETQDGTDEVGGDRGAVESGSGVIGDNDYQQTSGTLLFAGIAGEQHEILVPVNGDTVVELDEYFHVLLTGLESSNRDVSMGDSTGRIDIDNDDSATVLMGDVVVVEGDSGTTPASVSVTLSSPVDVDVTMGFTPTGGDVDSNDYQLATGSGTVTFNAGSQVEVVTVDVNGDTDFERHEDLLLGFSNLAASNRAITFEDADSKVTIINDDRNPLGMDAQHVLHSEPGEVQAGSGLGSFDFSVADNDRPLDLLFVATAAPGETLQVGPSVVVDSAGTPVAPLKIGHQDNNDPGKSYAVYRLEAGDYQVVVPGANGTSGLVELLVAMPGIMGTESVEDLAMQLATGGTLQSQLGVRGISATIFNDEMGIDLSQDLFEQELDADLDNIITSFDLMTINTNHGQDLPGIYLVESDITPASYFQVNPAGQDELNIAELFGFSLYQNPGQPLDVNADGNITPLDALTVIDSLNADGARSVLVIDSNPHPLMVHDRYLYDTNGDFSITAVDALHIINQLNPGDAGGPAGEGEAEGEPLTDGGHQRWSLAGQASSTTVGHPRQVAAVFAESVLDPAVGDEYRTSASSNSLSWGERVDSVFTEEDLLQEPAGADDLFLGLLH